MNHPSTGIVAGVDVGSVAAKAVVRDAGLGKTLSETVIPTGWNVVESGSQVLDAACRAAGIRRDELSEIIGTGYGRASLPFATGKATEISCHARGAHHLFPGTRTVLDIGGQDSKAIALDEYGDVSDFVMNDKCAAGTGRFLQVLSGILQRSLDEMGELAGRGSPVLISSMCAVFAETEIVGLLARGTKPEDIAAGVFLSIAKRMRGLSGRIPFTGECTFTGGLGLSPTFRDILGKELGCTVNQPENPQTVGALGAALIAESLYRKKVNKP